MRRNLGAGSYELGEITIETGGSALPPVPRGRVMMAAESAGPVAVEAGTSDVLVRVRGSIRLP